MQFSLIPHPKTPPLSVQAVETSVWRDGNRWHFRYLVEGAGQLILPGPAIPARTDELWRFTCFEAFVGGEGQSYIELNFSPSGQWAAYAFDAPREGLRSAPAEVEVPLEGGEDWIAVEAALSCEALKPLARLGLSAVIEEDGGTKSYWALAHAPGNKPDFHHPDCFVAKLP